MYQLDLYVDCQFLLIIANLRFVLRTYIGDNTKYFSTYPHFINSYLFVLRTFVRFVFGIS